MARFRVTGEGVPATNGAGPIRGQWEFSQKALSLFSTRERRAIQMTAAKAIGDFWIGKWLPERFTGYARRALGYKAGFKYEKSKRRSFGTSMPLVYTGRLEEAALTAQAKGMVGPRGPSVLIRIPTGPHRLAANVQQVLNTIPASEVDDLAKEFGRAIIALTNGGNVKIGKTRRRLTAAGRVGVSLRLSRRMTKDYYRSVFGGRR